MNRGELAISSYNRENCKTGIVHLGVGNFHRAHQAFFIHEMLNNNQDTSIIGINLRSDQTRKNLQKQNKTNQIRVHVFLSTNADVRKRM